MLIDTFFQITSSIIGAFFNVLPFTITGISINDIVSVQNTAVGWMELIPVDTCFTMLGYITSFWIAKITWSVLVFVYGKIPILGH